MTRQTISLDGIYNRLSRGAAPFYGLINLDRAVEAYAIDTDPDFQRGHVWTPAQQSAFIGHVLEGGDVSPLLVNTGPHGEWERTQLVDGKQRLEAGLRWAAGKIPAVLSDKREFWVDQLDKKGRTQCSLTIGLCFAMLTLTRKESLELYIRINRGGTVHKESEIENVRRLLAMEKR